MFVSFDTVRLLWPECVLVLLATWIIVFGGTVRPTSRFWWAMFAVAAYVVALFALFVQDGSLGLLALKLMPQEISGPLAVDHLGHSLRWMALLIGLIFTLIAAGLADRGLAAEVLGAIMLVVVGVMLVARANELVLLFVSLELISIPTYMLLFTGRRDRASAEAATKYFFLSILSSALLLYGFSFFYGMAGTTIIAGSASQPGIREILAAAPTAGTESLRSLAPIALVLVFAGLGFKIAAVPFHFYAPDVFQGATNANAGLLAVAPKVAGIAALVRLVVVGFPAAADAGWQLAIVLSILSMTIGNVCALWQTNIRRLLAYSSIAHAGYMLIGLAVTLAALEHPGIVESGGVKATLFYLAAYVITSLAVFAALAFLGSQQRQVSSLDELAGLARSRPLVAGVIAAGMFSLAGVPPLAGFWGKFSLFSSAVKMASADAAGLSNWFTALAIIGAINAAIAAAYYLRVVAVMYFQPASAPIEARGGPFAAAAMVLSAAMMLALGLAPGNAMHRAELSEQSAVRRESLLPRTSAAPTSNADAALPIAARVR